MKKILLSLMSLGVVALFANCSNNSGNSAAATIGAACYFQDLTTPTSYSYAQVSTPCYFNYNTVSGFSSATTSASAYGYSAYSAYGTGAASCGANQDVVYSPSRGVGCVTNTMLINTGQPAIYILNAATQSFILYSAPNPTYLALQAQYATYLAQYPQYGNSTYGQLPYGSTYTTSLASSLGAYSSLLQTTGQEVLRACDGNETCPTGQRCLSPFGTAASIIGICYF